MAKRRHSESLWRPTGAARPAGACHWWRLRRLEAGSQVRLATIANWDALNILVK